jgi:hypothetical protein
MTQLPCAGPYRRVRGNYSLQTPATAEFDLLAAAGILSACEFAAGFTGIQLKQMGQLIPAKWLGKVCHDGSVIVR